MREPSRRTAALLALGVLGVAALAAWLGLHRWLVTRWHGGEDFYAVWLGLRAFLLRGESPYLLSPSFVRAQAPPWVSVSGGLAPVSPPPALLLWLPWALIPDPMWALALWWVTLEAAVVLALAVAFFLLRWRFPPGLALLVVGLSLAWPPLALAVRRGDAAPLTLAALGLALAALAHRRDNLAGVLLAVALVHPERTWLAVLSVLVWAAARRRWAVWAAWAAVIGVGALLSVWLYPTAWWGYLSALGRAVARGDLALPYRALAEALPGLGGRLTRPVLLVLGVLLLREWVAVAWSEHLVHLAWTVGLGLTLAPWVGLPFAAPMLTLWLFPWWVVWALWLRAWRYTPGVLGGVSALVTLGGWALWQRVGAWGPGVALLPGGVLLVALYAMRWRATRAAWLDTAAWPG